MITIIISFILGALVGGSVGLVVSALLLVNRKEREK